MSPLIVTSAGAQNYGLLPYWPFSISSLNWQALDTIKMFSFTNFWLYKTLIKKHRLWQEKTCVQRTSMPLQYWCHKMKVYAMTVEPPWQKPALLNTCLPSCSNHFTVWFWLALHSPPSQRDHHHHATAQLISLSTLYILLEYTETQWHLSGIQ